jgi:hypothetical protein
MDDQQVVTQVVVEEARGPQSLMEQLRAKRQEVSDTVETFIPIQIFSGEYEGEEIPQVFVKYRVIERAEIEAIGKKVRKETRNQGEQMMRVMVDTLIGACEGFYVQPAETDDKEELVWPQDNRPVSDWVDMAQFLGLEPGQAASIGKRNAVFYVFGDKEFLCRSARHRAQSMAQQRRD